MGAIWKIGVLPLALHSGMIIKLEMRGTKVIREIASSIAVKDMIY